MRRNKAKVDDALCVHAPQSRSRWNARSEIDAIKLRVSPSSCTTDLAVRQPPIVRMASSCKIQLDGANVRQIPKREEADCM